MKALLLKEKGNMENLYIDEVPVPSPLEDEVLIEVHAVGLNPVDYKLVEQGHEEWTYPFILGLDVAGVVAKVGANVNNVQIGDRVAYHGDLKKPGGYAQYAIAPAHVLARIPEHVMFEEAAAVPCAAMTAYQAIFRRFPHHSIQTILIHGGNGAVGGFAIQLAKAQGWTVFTTCSTENNEHVKSLGADYVIDYHTQDITKEIHRLTHNQGVDVIINTISKESAEYDLQRLAFHGHLICIAGVADNQLVPPFTKAFSIHEIALGGAHSSNNIRAQADLSTMLADLLEKVAAKQLNPLVSEVITLEEIPTYLNKIKGRHVRGKIVAKVT